MKLDIKNAYEAYKAKFCIANNIQVTVHTYIFNNGDDYRSYGTLVPGFSRSQSSLNTSGRMTNGESVLLYKDVYTDNVLAHEFGHVFQFKLSKAKVRELDFVNGQLMANAIGLEVEEKNYKAICKQMGVDEYKDHGSMFQFKYKGTLYKYYKNLSEEEKFKAIQNVKSIHELVDEYEDHGSMFSFKYKGTTYRAEHRDYLSAEEEKLQFIKDIKNSHESLVSECDGLGNENTTLVIYIDENKEISRMYFQNSDKNIFKQLDKTFISRSNPEEEVEESNEVEQSNVEEEKSNQQDTQQPSNFLSNIFSAIKSIIDSISSLFSWLFESKEEKSDESTQQPSAANLSLLKPDVNHDADENYVGNYSLCNHDYHQHDDLI